MRLPTAAAAFAQDLRQALRSLRRAPATALVVIATVAAGVAASATVFALIDALFWKPLTGVADPSRLVNVHATGPDGSTFHSVSRLTWSDIGDGGRSFSGLAGFGSHLVSLRDSGGEPRLALAQIVTGNYFAVLGARPALGRLFSPSDDSVRGRDAVAVLAYGAWKSRFGADPSIVGASIAINGRSFTVVGIAERGFTGTFLATPFDLWVPTMMADALSIGEELDSRSIEWLELVGRLAPGVTREEASRRMRVVARGLEQRFPESQRGVGYDLRRTTGFEDEWRDAAVGFFAFLAVLSGLVLGLAGMNVSGILLARGLAREKELGVRHALGAGRRRIARLLLLETLLLFLAGGAAGAFLSTATTRWLERFRLPLPIPLTIDISPGPRVIFFALLASAAAGLLFGLAAALPSTRPAALALLGSGRSTTRSETSRLRATLVALQVAGSVLMLATAGLFLRSFQTAARTDPGFDADGLLLTSFDLSMLGYGSERAGAFRDALVLRAARLPGVSSAAIAGVVPLGPGNRSTAVNLPGRPAPEDRIPVDFSDVGEGYFSTMRIPIESGRPFDRRDSADSTPVAVVNETLARRLWPGRDPIGQVLVEDGKPRTVIGVAKNGKYRRLWEEPRSFLYVSARQEGRTRHTLLLRTKAPREALAAALGRELRELDPALPRSALLTAREHMGFALLPQRVGGSIAAALGAIGLGLASIGLTALVAHSVSRRRREIGVRLALGARPADVLRLEMRRGVRVAAAGLVLGTLAAFGAARLIEGQLVGVGALDPVTFGAVLLILSTMTLAATYIPARRAARVDPMRALGAE